MHTLQKLIDRASPVPETSHPSLGYLPRSSLVGWAWPTFASRRSKKVDCAHPTRLAPFNRFGLALVAPVTQGGGFAREHGFAVPLSGAGTKTQGVVLCHQVRMLDYRERGAKVIETVPDDIVDEVLARVRALLD